MAKVKCPICGEEFNKEKTEYVGPIKRRYYHKECWEKFNNLKEEQTDEMYKRHITDYLSRVLKVSYNWYLIDKQINNYLKEGKTLKGIFFTLKYYYDKNGKEAWEKGYGGIGIVEYYYDEAKEYWTNIELRKRGSCELIVQQIQSLKEAEKKEIKYNPIQKKKKKEEINFDEILKEDELDS